jgi:hypothetical protein
MPGYVPPPPPASAGLSQLVGALVLIDVVAFNPQVMTQFGVKDEVAVTALVVEHPNDPTWIGRSLATTAWNVNLVSQLRGLVGQTTLGRLVLGTARNGNHAPVRLDPPTLADQATADAFLAAPHSQPAVQAPPPGYPATPPPPNTAGGAGVVIPPPSYPAAQPVPAVGPVTTPPLPAAWPQPATLPQQPPF